MSIARHASVFLVLSAFSAFGPLAACGDGAGELPTVIIGPDSAPPVLPGDGAPQNRGDASVAGTIRLVHVAPGLPAIDVCTRRGPQELFAGPLLGRDRPRDAGADARPGDAAAPRDASADATLPPEDASATDAGATNGVAPLSASQYFAIEGSGTLEIAIVPANQGSCGQPLASGQVTLEPGRLKTVVVHGITQDGGQRAGVAAYDDALQPVPDRAKIRLIYASGGSTARLSATLYGTVTTPIGALDPLLPLRPEADAAVDGLGYATIDPRPPPTTLGLRAEGTDDPLTSTPADLGLAGTSVHTGFVVPSAPGYSILYCNDASTDGPRTQCTVLVLR